MSPSKIVPIQSQTPAPKPEPVLVADHRPSAVYFREVLRLLGGPAAGQDVTAAVAFNTESEPLMRQLTVRYGFDRLPATWGETFAFFEYADSLDAASGIGMRPKEQLDEWRAASFEVWRRKSPQLMPAIELYCAGRTDDLRALHGREDTLAVLGRHYLRQDE